MTNYIEAAVTVSPDWDTKIRADYSQAACPIQWLRDDGEWHSTPYQAADAGHRDSEDAKMVAWWLARQ